MVNKATKMNSLTLLEPVAAVSVFVGALVDVVGVLVSAVVVPKTLLALLSASLRSRKPGRPEIRVGSSSILLRRKIDDSESDAFVVTLEANNCLSHAFSRIDEATDGVTDDCFIADRV